MCRPGTSVDPYPWIQRRPERSVTRLATSSAIGVAAHSMYRSDERSNFSSAGWFAIATAIGAAANASVIRSRSMLLSTTSRSKRGISVSCAADSHVQPEIAMP